MRRVCMVVLAGLLATSLLAGEDKARSFVFGKGDKGKVARGWKADKTGKGVGSVWKVVADETAPSKKGYALAQTAEGPGPLFNLCVATDTSYKDIDIRVQFKAVKGK